MWVILHVKNSGFPILENLDNLSQVTKVHTGAIIVRLDGGDVEVEESYESFEKAFRAKTMEVLLGEAGHGARKT